MISNKIQDIFVEAHISDLHFGVINPSLEYEILTKQFTNYIADMNVLDIVSINGDIFDHKFLANSDNVLYAAYFINDIVNICKKKNATLIIISGTYSHDADQLKMFYPYLNDPFLDLRLAINDAIFTYIKGKKILLIPELYNKGSEYYEKLLNYGGYYDSCYMHGTYVGAIRNHNERNLNSEREPVFHIQDFGRCYGPIISGHNHIHSVYGRDFYYCGSPIRWEFGEEQEKGFLILLHNIKTRKYIIHFEPIYSFRYDTINMDELLKNNKDPKSIIDSIKTMHDNGIDYVRAQFTINCPEKLSILKSYYRNDQTTTIYTDFEQEKIKKELEKMESKYKQYDYLFSKELKPEEILLKYISQTTHNVFMTLPQYYDFMKKIERI